MNSKGIKLQTVSHSRGFQAVLTAFFFAWRLVERLCIYGINK
ncbi:hypothetical protein PseBG33_5368 [Pseudomonas synxantha BG33R]|nr:hypothetical protein PseBG33_5368 [Pseudomonas synxantha BG33R]